ncbi:MAG: glycosyltransferase family 39 protein [Thermodesulfobacteriota bacterium]|nr:glycosyltransferase family 39 protein [Thermodesulfobacteriota bacterium]
MMNHRTIHYPALLVMAWLVFFILPIGNRGLWAPDEPRYVQVAWEMWRAKSYFIPLMNGEIYAEKPPLFFWLVILFSKLFSFETASRWVSALSALGTILLTYVLGRQIGNKRLGFTASLVLVTCGLYTWLMTTGNIDTTLTFFTTLSLYFYLKWDSEKKRSFSILAYGACGLGILAKGPVALVIPWLVYALWEIVKHFRGEGMSLLHLVWGPFVAMAIVSVWLIPACITAGPEYTQTIIFKQNLGRAVKSFAHVRPWYYYFYTYPFHTLPWFIVFVGALGQFRRVFAGKGSAFSIVVLWLGTVFIFFSLLSGKREGYLLPSFPAFSLIIAFIVAKWDELDRSSPWIRIAGVVGFVTAMVVLTFALSVAFLKEKYPVFGIFPGSLVDWRLWAVCGLGILAMILLRKALELAKNRQSQRACNLMAIAMLILASTCQIYFVPYIDPVKSAKGACEEIKAILPADGTIAFYRKRYDNGWNFYLKRDRIPVINAEELKQKKLEFDMIILRKKDLSKFEKAASGSSYKIASTVPIGSKEFVLLKLNLQKEIAARMCF